MKPACITGIGAVTALGFGVDALFEGLTGGVCGLRARPWFASEGGPVGAVDVAAPGGEVLGEAARSRGWALTGELGIAAAEQALVTLTDRRGLWVVGATTTSGMQLGEAAYGANLRQEVPAVPTDFLWRQLAGRTAQQIQAAVGATGQRLSVSAACVSGTAALGLGWDLLRTGRARRVLVVGAESLCTIVYYGFNALGVHSASGSRPFDVARDGMSLGEGAAAMLLETPEAAAERGADVLACLTGYGNTADAHHLTAPHPEALGAIAAIERALGSVDPTRVDYYNAHGTGTPLNDAMEALAVQRTVASAAVAGVKGAVGHTLGAAGVVEAVVGVQAIRQGRIPPSVGLVQPECASLDLVHEVREGPVNAVLSTNFAFGGNNAAVLLEAP